MRHLIALLFFSLTALGQQNPEIQTVLATYPTEFETVNDLAKKIAYDFKTDEDRVEAIYSWITANIRYDYNQIFQQKPKNTWIRYRSQEEKKSKEQQALDIRLNEILRVKHTLCFGYSNLFKRLCDLMGLNAVTINGYTKRTVAVIGDPTPFKNHSWNAVYLDGKWQLFDLTWAAGYTDILKDRWLRERNDYYFNTDPQQLISTHLPADPNWQLLQLPLSSDAFFEEPIYYPSYYRDCFVLSAKEDGILTAEGRKVSITFSSIPKGRTLFYAVDGKREIVEVDRIKQTPDGQYRVDIFGLKKDARQLTLYSNLSPAIDFKLL
ncbi:transglutaminase domain-containing protein [Gilvibacter sp.]|uniref:transglutaminase domain-containing protein n=1 Tax=Gilvibacter sp. TaxID=2729997 RepID=UPI003F4A2C07